MKSPDAAIREAVALLHGVGASLKGAPRSSAVADAAIREAVALLHGVGASLKGADVPPAVLGYIKFLKIFCRYSAEINYLQIFLQISHNH